ncbi:hypothetical protein D0N36_07765 [Hymenobacter lapidiphilus]|nr:hypothetical protein D0N36_07765 [Hymenobacter sp. CCM 8763]
MYALELKKQYATAAIIPEDVSRFIEECEAGKFYVKAQALIDPTFIVNPSEFKIQFFAKVFFSSGVRVSQWEHGFAKHYPTVYASIRAFKKNHSNKMLAGEMQKAESDIMIQKVCAQLYKNGINKFYTIHDAIYCVPGIVEDVKAVIFQVYAEYGIAPSVKTKTKTK